MVQGTSVYHTSNGHFILSAKEPAVWRRSLEFSDNGARPRFEPASPMQRPRNIFYNIVTDENSTTELLCNLMRFDGFRKGFLELALPGVDVGEIDFEHIDTQADHGTFGRPDMEIRNSRLLALIEIKVASGLGPTVDQPKRYLEYLRRQGEPCRRLIFLVPSNWQYRIQIGQQIDIQRSGLMTADVQSHMITWRVFVGKNEAAKALRPLQQWLPSRSWDWEALRTQERFGLSSDPPQNLSPGRFRS